ncbi:MAG: hypothetical protein IPM55_04795 [Acidobacteria bacterium]|nr:hypothetical protein [Acidobacteriota bacterium]
MIEKAGFAKGYRKGRAAIPSKHPLAIVNLGRIYGLEILASWLKIFARRWKMSSASD